MSSILISVLLIVEVLAAFLLIVVILAQKSKDQGLGMAFGGGMGESLFGSRAGNVLTRMTVVLAAVFMVTTMALGILFAGRTVRAGGSVMDQADREMPVAPVAPLTAPQSAPLAAPSPMMEMGGDTPISSAEVVSEPVVMQMDEGGQLTTVADAVSPAVQEEIATDVKDESAPKE